MNFRIEDVKFFDQGLIPAVVQDARTLEVLTLAYMNEESLKRTIQTEQTWFWSRSRKELWHKGETSGNTQRVVELILDCDRDAIVVLVEASGPACHTGEQTCFHNTLESEVQNPLSRQSRNEPPRIEVSATVADLGGLLNQLYALIESRERERPEDSYTTYLFDEGLDKILKKLGEESAETIIAAKNDDNKGLIAEVSDLIYHLLVLLVERGVSLEEIRQELSQRSAAGKK
jgi:phosphoribosyl-ATP pyrophosphohydrolase/phosphoribosyl-AMP cyclohydrolase